MNVERSMCAASDPTERWEQIDWPRCEDKVRRLQARIVKAAQEGRHGKVMGDGFITMKTPRGCIRPSRKSIAF